MCFMLLSSPFSHKGLWSKYNGGKPIKSWSSLSMVREYGSTEQQQCSQSIALVNPEKCLLNQLHPLQDQEKQL